MVEPAGNVIPGQLEEKGKKEETRLEDVRGDEGVH